jgi:8-oxo-dGTP pyrophosphatase MutT (NUDIX family)
MGAWVDPETWYAQLASYYAATAALITDPAGNILLVKPNYRNHWGFSGGYVDAGEYPQDACVREVREELGLRVSAGPLLVVDWAIACRCSTPGHRPLHLRHGCTRRHTANRSRR